jgi:hypothetical protein
MPIYEDVRTGEQVTTSDLDDTIWFEKHPEQWVWVGPDTEPTH